MRKMILAVIVALLAGCCGTCFGRKLVEPDTLTFRKTYSMPGMTEKDLYYLLGSWEDQKIGLKFRGEDWIYRRARYHIEFDGQILESTTADIDGDVLIKFRDGEFDLIFTNIGAVWKRIFVVRMSTHDDRFNRTWLWRALRSQKILEQIRVRSGELFEVITASMDEYLKVGPPVELQKI